MTEITRNQAFGEIQQLQGQLNASSSVAAARVDELRRANEELQSVRTQLDESGYRERLLSAQVAALSEEIKRKRICWNTHK